jgi:hypothetical protein
VLAEGCTGGTLRWRPSPDVCEDGPCDPWGVGVARANRVSLRSRAAARAGQEVTTGRSRARTQPAWLATVGHRWDRALTSTDSRDDRWSKLVAAERAADFLRTAARRGHGYLRLFADPLRTDCGLVADELRISECTHPACMLHAFPVDGKGKVSIRSIPTIGPAKGV